MGIIAAVTPAVKTSRPIPRMNVSPEELQEVGRIRIHMYSSNMFENLQYKALPNIAGYVESADLLWKTTWLLRDEKTSWNGTMQMITKEEHPGKASILFMPMIDMDPNDESCIYSTLTWISDHAKKNNVTPVVTFDQPLWYKANSIVTSEPKSSPIKNVVVRLGAFHTEMSFLGSIGYIMNDTGLKDALSQIYAEKAVGHMLSGKAVQRAIRGHGIVFMALHTLLMNEVFGVELKKDLGHGS